MERQKSLVHWLENRLPQWRRLQELLKGRRDQHDGEVTEVLELVTRFRTLGRDVSLARALLPGGRLTGDLEALFLQAHEAVYRRPGRLWARFVELLRFDVPAVMVKLRGPFQVSVALFVAAIAGGWLLVHFNTELITLFASEEMIDEVHSGRLWTDDLLNVVPSSVLSVSIMTNNVVVSLMAFALGALYGLGTLYIIALNGLMLGAMFAFTGDHDMAGRLFNFVVAHGVVELTVILLSGAAGIHLGQALVHPGRQTRTRAFQQAVREAATLLPVVAIFLIGAGVIEGYVSPNDVYPLSFRVFVGIAYGVLLWMVLSGRIWPKSDSA